MNHIKDQYVDTLPVMLFFVNCMNWANVNKNVEGVNSCAFLVYSCTMNLLYDTTDYISDRAFTHQREFEYFVTELNYVHVQR